MCSSRRGFTLIELLVLIVVIGVSLTGVLLVFQNTVRGSANPQIYKQALAVAEAFLDEILLTGYDHDGPGANRADFNDVRDYAGYTSTGIKDIKDNAVAGLADYSVAVAVGAPAALNDSDPALPDVGESLRVTVTVTHISGLAISLDGYRMRYAP
jgi:MSHA pilin protein MshD